LSDELDLAISPEQKSRDKWAKRIEQYGKSFKTFETRGDKVISRFRNEREEDSPTRLARYNILYANIEVLGPACYSKPPKVQVSRRYSDRDAIARIASQVLERATSYQMDLTDFNGETFKCRDDYLLTGRGSMWVRYEPVIEKAAQDPDPDVDDDLSGPGDLNPSHPGDEAAAPSTGPTEDAVLEERAPLDYVHWKDFLHGNAQTWKQVPWVGRKVLLDKQSVDKRWPAQEGQQPLSKTLAFTHKQERDPQKDKTAGWGKQEGNLALIYELWDKENFKVCWYSPDLKTRLIEEVEDPLKLIDFFPCQEPLYGITTTDRLIPIADYFMYQDQAVELDILTQRITLLTKACALRGTYDRSNKQIADLLNERPENFMVPVDNWAAFAEKGGLPGMMSFVPIDQVIKVLEGLYKARALVIQDIYAITGISDIIRGNSNAQETATAQQIKGQYANLRLSSRRDKVTKFLRDGLRLMAEVICEHFGQDTLRKISGFDLMTEVMEAEKQQQGAADQLWAQCYQMLHNDPLRLTHLDIETNSMVEADKVEMQQERTTFLQTSASFIKEAVAAAQQVPEMGPLLGQMLLFGIRGFPIGRELESSFEAAIEKLEQGASQPKPPSPEQIKAQSDAEKAKADAAKSQQEVENQKAKNALAVQQAQFDFELAKKKYEMDERIAIMELNLKYGIQQAELATDAANDEARRLMEQGGQAHSQQLAEQGQQHSQQLAETGQQHSQQMAEEAAEQEPTDAAE
jgi:hypothetical protein